MLTEERKTALLESANSEDLEAMVEEEQFCLLMLFVAGAVINKTDYCLLITKDRSVALFPLLSRRQGPDALRNQPHQTLFFSSYTLVNLWYIIQELALG